MKNAQEFLEALRRAAKFVDLHPSPEQLERIAAELVKKPPEDLAELQSLVVTVCGPLRAMAMEGIDNSDIRTLLAIAVQVTKQA